MMTTKERNVQLRVQCTWCNKTVILKVAEEDYIEYTRPNRRNIREIFPYLSNAERELLISHTCEECWNNMFGDEEDEPQEEQEVEVKEEPQTEEYYTMDKVIEVISDLAKSQGFYGRLLENLLEAKEYNSQAYEEIKNVVESAKLKDPVDVVMFFES